MNKKARPTFTASGRTSVRVQNSTAAVLFRLFTSWTFCCGFAAGADNTSSIFSEVKSSFTASTSVLLATTSVYSSQSVQVNSSTENGPVSTSGVASSHKSPGTTATVPSVNTTTHSFQIHPSSDVPVTISPSPFLQTPSPSSFSSQSRTSLAATTVERSQSGAFSSALASVNASTSSPSQNTTRVSNHSLVESTIYSSPQSRAYTTTSISLQGSPSTLATDSLLKSQNVTATLSSMHVTAPSLLATETSPEQTSFTKSASSGGVSAAYSQIDHLTTSSLLRPSSTELAVTSSVIIVPSGFFVRFAIRVPLNESVHNASFKSNLEKGVLAVYKKGSSIERAGNVSVKVIQIQRLTAPDNTTVNVTFQVFNGSDPVLGYYASQSIRQSSISLAKELGYPVVLDPHVIMFLSTNTSISTSFITSSISSSLKGIGKTSVTPYLNSTQQSVAISAAATPSQQSVSLMLIPSVNISQSRKYTTMVSVDFTAALTSFLPPTSEVSQNQSGTTSAATVNTSAPPSTQVHSSSRVPLVTTSYTPSSISPRSSISEHSTILTEIPNVNTSQSRALTTTTALANDSGTLSSQILSSSEAAVVSTSYVTMSTPLLHFTSTQDQSRPHMQTTVNMSQSRTFSSSNASAVSSSQSHSSSEGRIATTSYVALSYSLNLSTAEVAITSSVTIARPGIFVRFAVRVPLNESLEDASFKNNLEKGILAAYENGTSDGMTGNHSVNGTSVNGTSDGMTGNHSVNIIDIKRSSLNGTKVNVTFQVLNGSEPVLADDVIRSIQRVEGSLAQAVGYKVVEEPHIVFLSVSSSLFSMLQTSSVYSLRARSSVNATLSSTQQAKTSLVPTGSLQTTLLSKTLSVIKSPSRSFTIVVPVNVSATPSSEMISSSKASGPINISTSIEASASDRSVGVLTQTSSLDTSQNRTFAAEVTSSTTARTTTESMNVSTKASSQMPSSIDVSLVTTSVASPSLLRPSSTEHPTNSSVTAIPPGIFVRFVISVPLNENVSDASFKANLTKGIFTAYENGSLSGASQNVSVNIVIIKRSSAPNDTMANVTVTFQVLSDTEPIPAYYVVQSIGRASVTLEQALGYKVIQDPFIVHLSSTSSLSTMPLTSSISSSFMFTPSLPATVNASTVALSKSDSVTGSLSRTPQTLQSSGMLSTVSRLVTTVSSFIGNTSHFPSSTKTRSSAAPVFNSSIKSSGDPTSSSRLLSGYVPSTGTLNRTAFTVSSLSLDSTIPSQTPHLPSESAAYQNSTVGTISSSDGMATSQAASPSSLNVSVLPSTGAKFSTPSPSSKHSVLLVTLNSTAAASSPSVVTSSTETTNVSETRSVSILNHTLLTRSAISMSTTLYVTSRRLSASSMSKRTASAPVASALSSILSNVTSTAETVPSRSLSLNSSPPSQTVMVQNSSFGTVMLATTSKLVVSSRASLIVPSTLMSSHSEMSRNATLSLGHSATMLTSRSTAINQSTPIFSSDSFDASKTVTSLLTSIPSVNVNASEVKTITMDTIDISTQTISANSSSQYSASKTTVMSGSETTSAFYSRSLPAPDVTTIESARSMAPNSTTVAHISSILPSYTGAFQTSPVSTNLSRPLETSTVVVNRSLSTRSASTTRFSGALTPRVSPTPGLTSSESIKLSMGTSPDSKPSLSVSSAKAISSSPTTQTIMLSKDLSKSTSLNITQRSTQEASVATPRVTSALKRTTTATTLAASSSAEHLSSATLLESRVSPYQSSAQSTVISPAVSSTLNFSVVSPKSSQRILLSSSAMSTRGTSESKSPTESSQISLYTSVGLPLTTEVFISTRTTELSSSSLRVSPTSVKSSVVETVGTRPLFSLITSKSSRITIHSTSSVHDSPSAVFPFSSAKAISSSPSSLSKGVSFSSVTGVLSSETFISSRPTTPTTSFFSMSRSSGVLSILLPSTTDVKESSSSLFRRSSVYSTIKSVTVLEKPSTTIVSSTGTSLDHFSSVVEMKSSSIQFSTSLLETSATTTSMVGITSSKTLRPTRVTETFIKASYDSTTIASISETAALSTVQQSLSTVKVATPLTPVTSSPSSKTSSTVSPSTEPPTEPVGPTAKANSSEGLVGIQLLVPLTEDEGNGSFRETIELRLAAAYRWGQKKGSERRKRDLTWIDQKHWGTATGSLTDRRELESWMKSVSYQMHVKRGRRFRREEDNIIVLAETIRRAKPIVGEELVDIEYRVFDGLTMLSAEHIVETMDRLSEAELVATLKYGITLRPYVVKEVEVEPTSAVRTGQKWETLVPAIVVPIVVVLFLIGAFLWARFVVKRKRNQKKVKPLKESPYKNLEVKVLPSHDVIPPKSLHGASRKKRPSISSTSSSSSSDAPSKYPTLPHPDYSPLVDPGKPTKQYRRRTDGKDVDHKPIKIQVPPKDSKFVNGHIKHEHHVKTSKDTRDAIEMQHLAGVVENYPQMREEKLAGSHGRGELSVRFAKLPPLVETSLVGRRSPFPEKADEERKEKERIIAESGVPQANVERWRNKMRHREKLRQDMREKEREKEKKLKKLENEENADETNGQDDDKSEGHPPMSQRSLTAERKRRSRLERWRKNRVGTSSSKGTSSSSSSSSSSSDSDSEGKTRDEKGELRKRKRKEKEKKKKAKVPPLATGQAAKEALRETAWTIKETPGVRLVSVRPHTEGLEQQPTEPTYLQNGIPAYRVPQTRPVSSRSQQRDRVHYLLETGYPVLPVMQTPLVQPTAYEYPEEEEQYEDMEGLDPYIPQYEHETYLKEDAMPNVPPPEPRQAFGGPTFDDDEHIYEEPAFTPASLPQTHLVTPRQNQKRALIPTQYASGYVGRSRGRPTSASQHPGATRSARSARPTSARTDPMPRYAPSPARVSPPDRRMAQTPLPGSRYMISNRPTVATAPQPSIGTSPRYMVDPERRQEPPSSYDGARMILSRAQANVDLFEQDSRVNVPDETDAAPPSAPLYATPKKKAHAQPIVRYTQSPAQKGSSPTNNPRLEMAAMERAELEAQLLVSRALARARTNVRT